MSRPWFRMYAEFASDPKVQLLSFDDQRHFVVLLCLKCSGTLDSAAPNEDFFDRMVAKALGLDVSAALEAKRRLSEIGVIDQCWQPERWDSRQYDSDKSTERTRAWRSRNSEASRERSGDVTVTDESRSDKSREEQNREEGASAPVLGLDAASFERWRDYRKQIRKPLKPASIPAAQRALAAFGSEQVAVVEQSIANGWQGLFPLKTTGADNAGKPRKTRYEQLYGS